MKNGIILFDEARKNNEKAEKKIYHYAATLLMLHTNNEIDRSYYFTILRTPWGEQMEDGLLCNSMGRIVDRNRYAGEAAKKKLLKTMYDSYSMVERTAL